MFYRGEISDIVEKNKSVMRYLIKFTQIIFSVIVFYFVGFTVFAQENPFLKMTTKNYADYCFELNRIAYINVGIRDEISVKQTVIQMREAAKISKNKKWEIEADFCEIFYRFQRNLHLHNKSALVTDTLLELTINNMQQIIQQAKKIKAADIELRAMRYLWDCYIDSKKDYEMAFRYSLELDKRLSTVSAVEFPFRPIYYHDIGKLYYEFHEYETAKTFFEKGLENITMKDEKLAIRQMSNNLGLIYRNHYKDLEKSNSYFLKILDTKPEAHELSYNGSINLNPQDDYEIWIAIAKGNLGTNSYLRGDYDEAIPLLIFAVENVIENNPYNYRYAASKTLTLAEIFLEKSDLQQVKFYADKSMDFMEKDRVHHKEIKIVNMEQLWLYYNVMSRYYRMSNNADKAFLYADSAVDAHKRYEEDFNLRKLFYAEQHIKQQELEAQILKSQTYYKNMIMFSICAVVFLILTLIAYYHFHQKRKAYSALIIKTQQWAETPFVPLNDEIDSENTIINLKKDNEIEKIEKKSSGFYQELFTKLNKLIIEQQLYLNTETSLESMEQIMKINRKYISQAVNNCTGDSFIALINEYRVKEAVRLMSDNSMQNSSIEGIAFEVGFNDRITFYRVFKKLTGFSPTDFKNKANKIKVVS